MEKPYVYGTFFGIRRSVIIPMDHPMFGGPVPGLEDPLKTIQRHCQY